MIRLSLAAAAALLLAVGAAQAQPRRLGACQNDVQTLCGGVQPGAGRIVQCLKAHADQVSQGCKSAIAAAQAARREHRAEQGQNGDAAPPPPPPSNGGGQ
ncbi:MAG TPA: cysteine rich repeat-containing protein [Caulobacteraceae bacterium]|nr:cysteine rich repeat-containing protein [Caulobacteraceae bacterium]